MAKIVQVLTRPSPEYDLGTAEAQVRDLDAIVEKLNTTFQEELKDEVITSSPTPISNARKANTKASVPLLHPIVFSTPIRLEKLSSNLAISCPPIYWPPFKTLETSLSISEPISWNCLSKVNGGICIVNILTLNHICMVKKTF